MKLSVTVNIFIFLIIGLYGCTKDKGELDLTSGGYPQEIAEIITTKCAITGCHNDGSKDAAGGLSLTSWDNLFKGSRNGAVLIPYNPDHSTLMYYTNSFNEFGDIQLTPKMPLNNSALSFDEMSALYNWIKQGANSASGKVLFAQETNRKKFYVSNQGCDVVTIFDAQSMLATRVVEVGKIPGIIEAPHFIKISPDNKYWYVSFLGSDIFQKYRISDNTLVAQAIIGYGSWNTFAISSDGQYAYVVDWSSSGKVKQVKLDSMIVKKTIGGLNWSHGSALNQTNDTLYVTSQFGNFLFKIPVDFSSYEQIVLDNSGNPNSTSSLDPHEILMSKDYSKYFVSCQKSNEIKIVNALNDQVIATIPVGDVPQEMALAPSKNYLFVTCMEDVTTFGPPKRGSVYVINYQTNTIVAKIYSGHQPHGIMVDETNGRVYVTNRNITNQGPSPHHASVCNGRNGYVTAIDLNTLQLIVGFKAEVSADPYGYSIMH